MDFKGGRRCPTAGGGNNAYAPCTCTSGLDNVIGNYGDNSNNARRALMFVIALIAVDNARRRGGRTKSLAVTNNHLSRNRIF